MKHKTLLIFLSAIVFWSCSTTLNRVPSSKTPVREPHIQKHLADIETFQNLTEEALVWREKSVAFYKLHQNELTSKKNLTHQDIQEIHKSARTYLGIRNNIMTIVNKFDLGLGENTTLEISEKDETKIYLNEREYVGLQAASSEPISKILLNPNDELGQEITLKMKLSLAAATLLYDNYLVGIYPYERNRKTRKILNEDFPDYRSELKKLTNNFFSLRNRLKFMITAKHYKEIRKQELETKSPLANEEDYLDRLISSSPVYLFMIGEENLSGQPLVFRAIYNRVYDQVRFINESFTFVTSKLFGNTIGIVSTRDGYLKNLSLTERLELHQKMKPLDILLEKTPFRLTDKFIPGHYGHVAIWVGSEAQLKDLGVWDHPSVEKHHEMIRNGHQIIEALRPGVQINTLEHFLNIDDLLVLRHKNLSIEEKRSYLVRAFEQIGKEYDFNFDVETDKRIVCSEIVYVVFHDIKWPTSKTLGRHTISPDNVVSKAISDGPLEPIIIYHDGKKSENPDLNQELLNIISE